MHPVLHPEKHPILLWGELNAIPRNLQELFRNRKIGQAYEAYTGVDYGFEGVPCG